MGTPVPLGSPATAGRVVTDGIRAYAAWVRASDHTVWLAATDLRTGATAWPARKVATGFTLDKLIVEASAVVVFTRQGGGYHLYSFDPATGAPRWHRDGGDAENVVFAANKVLTMQPGSGEVVIGDISTGQTVGGSTLDAPSTGGDKYVRVLGTSTAADEARIGRSGPPANFADPGVVYISGNGYAWPDSAHVNHAGAPVSVVRASPQEMVVIDGWLVTHNAVDPQHIQVTSTNGPTSTNGATGPIGGTTPDELGTVPGRFVTFGACGSGRVCVVTQQGNRPTEITAFDLATKRQLWQTAGKVGGDQLSTAGGYTMLGTVDGRFDLFDPRGHRTFTSRLPGGGWLDPAHLLISDPEGSGRLARLTVADRKLTLLGSGPGDSLACASTAVRLVCVNASALTTYGVG